MIELFKQYPQLAGSLPHCSLGTFPTPVQNCLPLARAAGLPNLFLKRDDLTGTPYGGNKVRKLEFLLGAARRAGSRTVITMGFAGSNHALATALYARQQGLRAISLLMPQVNARYVRTNLLAGQAVGADLRHYPGLRALSLGCLWQVLRCTLRDGRRPTLIPGGGSSPLGLVGYVNAAFELRAQIQAGILPKPDCIYVAMGSMGTAAGLLLGLRAVGLQSEVIPIRVIEARLSPPSRLIHLATATATLLHKADPSFPRINLPPDELRIRDEFIGPCYAGFTEAGVEAALLLQAHAGFPANGAYTAKAFAALLSDARSGRLADKTVLFWNTFNSHDLSPLATGIDFRRLPRAFHCYFTEDVQPLDQTAP